MNHYFTSNENLKSNLSEISFSVSSVNTKFFTDLGVFSKDKIDYGSKLLIDEYLKVNQTSKKILDIGCGYGVIGITIAKVTGSEVVSTDINPRCVHLTNKNIKLNDINGRCFLSDAYQNINDKFDVIITNPPIRVGKDKVMEILSKAKDYLLDNGELWFVIRKNQGALSIAEKQKNIYNLEIIKKSKGYIIFKGKKY